MTTSAEIEMVKESTLETQKVLQELLEVTSMQQSSIKKLSGKSASKNPDEITETKEKLKKQIQHERKLTRKVESILEKQSTVLKQNRKTNESEAADEIKKLSVLVSNQIQSLRVLKATLLSLELQIDQQEKAV